MSVEGLINDIGTDVEIWRREKRIDTTKAAHNHKKNIFDFTFDTDIQIEDMIHSMDSGKTYKVVDVVLSPKKSYKIVKVC